jgi:hypothetical protein
VKRAGIAASRRGLDLRKGRFRASARWPIAAIPGARAEHRGPDRRSEAVMDDEIARAARAKKGSPFLSTEQAAFYLGLSARKLQQMRAGRGGPQFRRHSRYVIDDLDEWSRGDSRPARGDG